MSLVHGTCIFVAGAGVLLRGPSGSGKSDLAFRLIEAGDAVLVADDQTSVAITHGRLEARAPANLAGLIELRGVGIVALHHQGSCPIDLVIDMVGRDDVPRLPEPQTVEIMHMTVPLYRLCAFEASAPAKVRALARRHVHPKGADHA